MQYNMLLHFFRHPVKKRKTGDKQLDDMIVNKAPKKYTFGKTKENKLINYIYIIL